MVNVGCVAQCFAETFPNLLERFKLQLSAIGALAGPKWGIWLGRKTCIPSAPVFVGIERNREDLFRLLIGEKLVESFTRQEEVANFIEGNDSLPDMPVSFDIYARKFTPRRVMLYEAKIME